MSRYNIFNQVHKGLRGLLYETALALQQTDFLSSKDAGKALQQVEDVVELFEKHAHSEDSSILPALQEYEPSVAAAFRDEHDRAHELTGGLKESVLFFRQSDGKKIRAESGKAIDAAFVEFMVFNLEHMAKEGAVLNELLWRYYTDEQLQQFTRQIVAQLSPEILVKYSRCMMRGLNNSEIIAWLAGIRDSAPDIVFSSLLVTARGELSDRRWLEIYRQTTKNNRQPLPGNLPKDNLSVHPEPDQYKPSIYKYCL